MAEDSPEFIVDWVDMAYNTIETLLIARIKQLEDMRNHCVSDRSRKHMAIRSNELGEFLGELRKFRHV